jgi:threonylcarbamoyladenosine tRNA methylthiotransferase MtaB
VCVVQACASGIRLGDLYHNLWLPASWDRIACLTFECVTNIIAFGEVMETRPRVAFYTLGCKLNQAESELLARQFAEAGYYDVSGGEAADICILNTCTVTHIADRKSRHLVRLLRRRNPGALIIATGCYAERMPDDLAGLGADLVVGNGQKTHLLELVKDRHISMSSCAAGQDVIDGVHRIRSFIKIQDGCSGVCAYCVVPQVRRREYCLPLGEILDEISTRVAAGYKEVVLTGTEIGTYKYNGAGLKYLVKRILSDTGVERLHLSSLQPQEILPELLGLWRDSRLCRHFHLALQSGSDAVLRRMKRRYNVDDYSKAVSLIRQAAPGVAITTDIMVGFPGESAGEFEESYRFCQEIGFAIIHVFAYSARPGTLAAKMPGQIGAELKKERSLRMLELAKQSSGGFGERLLGQKAMVLWENEIAQGSSIYSGLSDNYVRVFTNSQKALAGRLLPVKLLRLHEQGLWGEVIE